MAPPRGAKRKRTVGSIERAAKRADQKAAGVFDGRFRPRVVKSGKRYVRRKRVDPADE